MKQALSRAHRKTAEALIDIVAKWHADVDLNPKSSAAAAANASLKFGHWAPQFPVV